MLNTTNENDTSKRTYTVEEIAEILEIGKTSAYRLVKQGQFGYVKIGTSIRISKKSFDCWLDNQTIQRRN